MEINDYLPEGLAYPSLGDEPLVVLPRQFQLPDGEVAEWYYQRLLEQQPPPADSSSEQGEPSDTAPSPRAGRAGEGAEAAATSQPQQQPSPAGSPCEQGEPNLNEDSQT
jgi:hypothetical protein